VTGTGGFHSWPPFRQSYGGTAPLAVNFTDVSTGTMTNRFWNFGDGSTTNSAPRISPTFMGWRDLTVSLTVSDAFGSNSMTRAGYINITNVLHRNFVANPTDGSAPFQANFTDNSTGTITNRVWDLVTARLPIRLRHRSCMFM